jgi:mannose-6-phosphate isomerase-like protein (cupin superfamily)
MRIRPLLLAALVAGALAAADPAGLVYWPKGTPPAGGKGAKFDNHGLGVSHRDKSGVAEVHENQTDIVFVQSGEAKLVVGGHVVDQKTESPGEIRGSAIKDGVEKMLSPGDVVHIPYGMPHQFFLEPGKQITYLVVKVTKP